MASRGEKRRPIAPHAPARRARDGRGPLKRTLPAAYYTDERLFRVELERFFCTTWVCAGRADQIAGPGDYVLRTIGDESVIVVRDGRGSIGAFFNVCRHRGTRLCTEPAGRFGETIQCPYHAWTYDLEGRLVGAPHMDEVAGFSRSDYPLHAVGVEAWDGHVFVNLARSRAPAGETAPAARARRSTGALARPGTLAAQLGGLPAKLRPWRMADLRLGARIVYDVAANWKLIVQNYSECLHCPVIHPALQRLSHYMSGENDPPAENYFGGRMELRAGIETMSLDGRRRRACLAGLSEEDRRRVYYYAVFPNLLLSLHPDYMMTHTIWPRAVDRTEVVCEWHFDPAEMARPGFHSADAVGFWDRTNREDWQVSELSQLGIKSRAYTPGPYSTREGLLHAFDRMIVERHARAGSGSERQPRAKHH